MSSNEHLLLLHVWRRLTLRQVLLSCYKDTVLDRHNRKRLYENLLKGGGAWQETNTTTTVSEHKTQPNHVDDDDDDDDDPSRSPIDPYPSPFHSSHQDDNNDHDRVHDGSFIQSRPRTVELGLYRLASGIARIRRQLLRAGFTRLLSTQPLFPPAHTQAITARLRSGDSRGLNDSSIQHLAQFPRTEKASGTHHRPIDTGSREAALFLPERNPVTLVGKTSSIVSLLIHLHPPTRFALSLLLHTHTMGSAAAISEYGICGQCRSLLLVFASNGKEEQPSGVYISFAETQCLLSLIAASLQQWKHEWNETEPKEERAKGKKCLCIPSRKSKKMQPPPDAVKTIVRAYDVRWWSPLKMRKAILVRRLGRCQCHKKQTQSQGHSTQSCPR